jgi:Flp pilus assembly pilin Flp
LIRLIRDEEGAMVVEYNVLVALIAAVIILAPSRASVGH